MSSNSPVKKILVLTANAKHTKQLRLDEEVRDIQEGLQRSLNREKFDLRYDLAVRPAFRKTFDYMGKPLSTSQCGHHNDSCGPSFGRINCKFWVKPASISAQIPKFPIFSRNNCSP